MFVMKALKEIKEALLVDVEVSPHADGFRVTGYNPWRGTLEVKIKSPPTKGKANQELVKEFSLFTGQRVRIISGHKSRRKTIQIPDMTIKEFLEVLKRQDVDVDGWKYTGE